MRLPVRAACWIPQPDDPPDASEVGRALILRRGLATLGEIACILVFVAMVAAFAAP